MCHTAAAAAAAAATSRNAVKGLRCCVFGGFADRLIAEV
jgi:hypothetical protein